LVHLDQFSLLQDPDVPAQVAVGQPQLVADRRERALASLTEHRQDAQPYPLVRHLVQVQRGMRGGLGAHRVPAERPAPTAASTTSGSVAKISSGLTWLNGTVYGAVLSSTRAASTAAGNQAPPCATDLARLRSRRTSVRVSWASGTIVSLRGSE